MDVTRVVNRFKKNDRFSFLKAVVFNNDRF